MSLTDAKRCNLQYCALQFLYWMLACLAIPFSSVYLLDFGYSNTEIGLILAVGYVVGMLLQPLTAMLADSVSQMRPSAFLSMLCAAHLLLAVGLLFCRSRSVPFLILFTGYFSLQNALRPHINSFAFYIERAGVPIRFGMARGCGSLAWCLTSLLLGFLLERFSPSVMVALSGAVDLLLLFLLSGITVRRALPQEEQAQSGAFGFLRGNPVFLLLLFGIIFDYFGFSFINNYPYQIVSHAGGTRTDMSRLVSFIAVVELPAMFGFEFLYHKLGCKKLIVFSAVFFVVRNVLLVLCGSVASLFLTNSFHMLSYAILIPATIRYTEETVDAGNVTTAQALLTAAMGVGNILSSISGGWMIDLFSVGGMLTIGATATALGSAAVISSIALAKKPADMR